MKNDERLRQIRDGWWMAGHRDDGGSFQTRQHTPPHLTLLTSFFLPFRFLSLSPQIIFSTVVLLDDHPLFLCCISPQVLSRLSPRLRCQPLNSIPFSVLRCLFILTVTMGAHSAVWQGTVCDIPTSLSLFLSHQLIVSAYPGYVDSRY
jgi:hypothetical protein